MLSALPAPRISVVICTRNRAPYLPEALRALERIRTSIPWELVVVDNGSTDETAAILGTFAQSGTVQARVLPEPMAGLSRARNTGWRAARGDIVAFTDDDCYPEPDYIDRIDAAFQDASIAYIGGCIDLHDPADRPITILTGRSKRLIPARTIVEPGEIQGANMAARRSVLETVGGFDETLGAGTPFPAEDVEFVCQASFAGLVGAYDPGPVVRHHHRRQTDMAVRALQAGYARGRGAYHLKCFLDPARRRPALTTWYWRARARPWRTRFEVRYLSERLQEFAGAAGYLFYRPR
jgi:glycosyltransferase involved in cell wall biosynthesis